MPDSDKTRDQIISAAAEGFARLGYDKTSMSDVAQEAGLSRRTIYLYFKGKEELFEALVVREWMFYAQTWLEYVESDPRGGTLGGYIRATLHAINCRPFIATLMRRDRRVLGSYLRKPDNVFSWLQSSPAGADLIRALQAAGAVRPELDPVITAHIIELITYGQLTIDEFKPADQIPPFEAVMEALADNVDRMLTPDGGGDSEAGKAVIRQVVAAARARYAASKAF